MTMHPPPLVPPEEAPPSAWRKRGFNLQASLSGAAIGIAVALVAFMLDASPWWWLAVPVGLLLGGSLRFHVSVLWARK